MGDAAVGEGTRAGPVARSGPAAPAERDHGAVAPLADDAPGAAGPATATLTAPPAPTGAGGAPGGVGPGSGRGGGGHGGDDGGRAEAVPGVVTHLQGAWRTVAVVLGAATLVVAVALRFIAHTPLWLDEALTVDIARLPLKDLHAALRRDGAPPLYYVLLHFWMKLFGNGDEAIRSLSGVFSVATLPVAWVAARQYAGRTVAWVTLLLLASAPFAVDYATSARMYSLVMFLTACGMVALQRALRQPRVGNLVALGLVTGALLYSHYWAVYLLGVLGVWLLWQARPAGAQRSGARWSLLALAVGALTFVPWLPTFVFQSAHTGTPWAKPPNLAAGISTVAEFTENQGATQGLATNEARVLLLFYFAIGGLALFGLARDRWHVLLDLRTQPIARPVALVVVGTLLVAVGGALVSNSGYSDRYAAVVFVPFIVLVALGSLTLADARIRTVVVAVAVAAGMVGAAQDVSTQRTQAAAAVALLNRPGGARAGDVVAFCPDQLGPAVYRLLPADRYRTITYPRGTSPAFVDWIDYDAAIDHSPVPAFANRLVSMARPGHHTIWMVWQAGYQGYTTRCQQLVEALTATPGYQATTLLEAKAFKYYEAMQLTKFSPVAPPPAGH